MTAEDLSTGQTNIPYVDSKLDSIIKNNYTPARVIGTDYSYKHEIVWKNAIGFLILHLLALWGLFVLITGGVGFKTFLWGKKYKAFLLYS